MTTPPKKPSHPSHPSQSKKLSIGKKQELEKWSEKMKNNDNAIKEGREFVSRMKPTFDPEETLKKIAREIIPNYMVANNKENDGYLKIVTQALYDCGLDNHCSIIDTVEEIYRGMIVNLRKELIKEFDCKNYSEKALVDIIVNAYARNLSCSKRLISTSVMGHTTPGLNNFMAIMSKEVDRANRIFLSALETLKSIKQPGLKVNIKTNTAFVSQNQEFNNNNNKNETVEAK